MAGLQAWDILKQVRVSAEKMTPIFPGYFAVKSVPYKFIEDKDGVVTGRELTTREFVSLMEASSNIPAAISIPDFEARLRPGVES